jgi:hypothetical protein
MQTHLAIHHYLFLHSIIADICYKLAILVMKLEKKCRFLSIISVPTFLWYYDTQQKLNFIDMREITKKVNRQLLHSVSPGNYLQANGRNGLEKSKSNSIPCHIIHRPPNLKLDCVRAKIHAGPSPRVQASGLSATRDNSVRFAKHEVNVYELICKMYITQIVSLKTV